MPPISATEESTFRVKASIQQVYRFFINPNQLRELLSSVEVFIPLGNGKARWVLEEMTDKGIRFKADYTVLYEGNGVDHVHWQSLEGNMGNKGDVWLTETADGGTEIRYVEMVAPELQITPIMTRLIKPLVARELRANVKSFLDRVKGRFNGV
jgi:uncharacterized membrane protein